MTDEKTLDISWGTIFKIGIACVCFYAIYLIKDILIWFIFALIISLLFDPAISFLQKIKISRPLATIFVYVFVFGILGFLVYLIAPIFVSEIQQFTKLFPQYFEKFAPPLKELGLEAFENFEVFTQEFQSWLIQASSSIFSALVSIFGGISSTITIFMLALFLSLDQNAIEETVKIFSPRNHEKETLALWNSCQTKVSSWFGSRILTCIFVAIISYIALRIFKIDYPFALSLFAGILDIVPMVGPIIAGVVIALMAALDSWTKAILVIIVFTLIQQIEGNILTPLLSKSFIGLSPVLVLLSLAIGGKLWGALGAILAIPITGILFEFTRDYLKKRKEVQDRKKEDLNSVGPPQNPPKTIIW